MNKHNLRDHEGRPLKGDGSVVELTDEISPDEEHFRGGDVSQPPEQASRVDTQEAKLTENQKELAELKDKYLRALADHENARKRIRQQSEDSVRIQRENLLRELLPVVDNLERAVGAARGGGNGKSIVEGVEMVLRSMLDLLKTQGVTPMVSVGHPFDPAKHEAADHVPSDSHPPNTVVQEFHRGYQMGDRVLRPARVTVAKGGSEIKTNEGEPER